MGKNFLQSMKEIFRDWDLKVMSYVMLVVTATCVITATVAWFTFSISASVQNMEIKTGDSELIKVAVEDDGEDVELLRARGETPVVAIEMPVFTNVVQSDNQVLAPGVHGTLSLYITALKPDVKSCQILPSFFGSEGDEEGLLYTGDISDEEKAVIKQLVRGHILLFQDYDEESNEYSGLLTEEEPMTASLSWDKEKNKGTQEKVTIYWYWPYEYEDVPEEAKKLEREMLFDPQKDLEGTYTDSRLYDYADTRIGSYVKSVKFHFEVKAIYGNSNR